MSRGYDGQLPLHDLSSHDEEWMNVYFSSAFRESFDMPVS